MENDFFSNISKQKPIKKRKIKNIWSYYLYNRKTTSYWHNSLWMTYWNREEYKFFKNKIPYMKINDEFNQKTYLYKFSTKLKKYKLIKEGFLSLFDF